MRKIAFCLLLVIVAVIFSGCKTVPYTVAGGAAGFGKGIKEDTTNAVDAIYEADEWFRQRYW